MKNLPISDYVKNYYQEHNIVLDDFTRATIIWIFSRNWTKSLSLLREIADNTTDEALKLQIEDRLAFELQEQAQFMKNPDNKYIYRVVEGDNGRGLCFFSTVERAMEYGKEYCDTEIRMDKFTLDPMDDQALIKTCIWDKSGTSVLELNPFSYGEFPEPEDTHGKKERFEEAFIPCAFPFERGDIVRHIVTDEVGVLETSREEWEKMLQRVVAGELPGHASDITVDVDYVEEDGSLTCEHRSVLNLELATEFESEEEEELLQCMSRIILGKEMLANIGYCMGRYMNTKE